jgi:hypothetical protein
VGEGVEAGELQLGVRGSNIVKGWSLQPGSDGWLGDQELEMRCTLERKRKNSLMDWMWQKG